MIKTTRECIFTVENTLKVNCLEVKPYLPSADDLLSTQSCTHTVQRQQESLYITELRCLAVLTRVEYKTDK